jgi:hypothetical protein
MPVNFNPNPDFNADVVKATEEKFRSILSIRCAEHNSTPHLANIEGKLTFETCCAGLDRQVHEAMGK